jgi:hypothetical protein
MNLWLTRLAAAIVVIAGPALLLYAAADIYSRYPLGREGWPFPLSFQLAAAYGYALAIGLVSAQYGIPRTLVAAIGCIIVPILTAIVTMPLMFGLTDARPPASAWVAWMALFALPTALWQVLVLREPAPAFDVACVAYRSAFRRTCDAGRSPSGGVAFRHGIVARSTPCLRRQDNDRRAR